MRIEELQTVGDYVTIQRGSTYKGELVGHPGPPLLGLGSIEPGGGFRRGHFKSFGGECPAKWMVPPGGMYVALKGATKDGSMVGSVARLPRDLMSGRLTQDTARLDFRDQRPDVTQYLYWVLRTPHYRDYCAGRVTGSASASFSREDFLAYAIPPPSDRANAIVRMLEGLEEKVEQNRRTGQALERLARATFKAWFVDFEPVKAKAAGQTSFPGMPPAAFAELPDRLTDSSLGPVPQGWEVKSLSDAFDINPPRRLAKGADAPYLDMKNMPTDGHSPDSWERRPHGSGMKFINGDTLVARITPCLENGKTAYVDFLDDDEVAWGSTEYIVLRPKPPLPSIFAYCLARMEPFREYAIQNMSGTSGRQRVAASAMEHYHVAVPDAVTARSFADTVELLFHHIRASKIETRKLAALRDYLLPRLLSGRVRVRDAEHAVGAR